MAEISLYRVAGMAVWLETSHKEVLPLAAVSGDKTMTFVQ
jgi:hypothetical protein